MSHVGLPRLHFQICFNASFLVCRPWDAIGDNSESWISATHLGTWLEILPVFGE